MREPTIECENCKKQVPNASVCVSCGFPLVPLPVPKLSPKELKVLKHMGLSTDKSSANDVKSGVGGSVASARVVMHNLLKFGLIKRVERGYYTVTSAGTKTLEGLG